MRKSNLIIGISLVIQSITMFILFLSFMNKNKKQLAGTFLTVGIIGGVVGAWMLYLEYVENAKQRHIAKMDACYECGEDCEDCMNFDGFDDFDFDDEVKYTIQDGEEEPEIEVELTEEPADDKE